VRSGDHRGGELAKLARGLVSSGPGGAPCDSPDQADPSLGPALDPPICSSEPGLKSKIRVLEDKIEAELVRVELGRLRLAQVGHVLEYVERVLSELELEGLSDELADRDVLEYVEHAAAAAAIAAHRVEWSEYVDTVARAAGPGERRPAPPPPRGGSPGPAARRATRNKGRPGRARDTMRPCYSSPRLSTLADASRLEGGVSLLAYLVGSPDQESERAARRPPSQTSVSVTAAAPSSGSVSTLLGRLSRKAVSADVAR